MSKRVLITGAAGFTGRHMQALLEQQEGYEVCPLQSDLLDVCALEKEVQSLKPDWVVHLAAKSFVADEDLLGFYQVNVLGTEHLLQALSRLPQLPQRILLASSANVYGTPELACIHEGVLPLPVNHYASSKLAMEHMARTWFDKLPIVITRPFNYTGIGQAKCFIIPKIVEHYAKRKPVIELGNIQVRRDFSDVADVVSAYFALMCSDVTGKVVNVCRGEAVSISEVLQMMTQISKFELKVKVNPAFVRSTDIPVLCGDNHLLQELIGQSPKVSIEQTLTQMYEEACLC